MWFEGSVFYLLFLLKKQWATFLKDTPRRTSEEHQKNTEYFCVKSQAGKKKQWESVLDEILIYDLAKSRNLTSIS